MWLAKSAETAKTFHLKWFVMYGKLNYCRLLLLLWIHYCMYHFDQREKQGYKSDVSLKAGIQTGKIYLWSKPTTHDIPYIYRAVGRNFLVVRLTSHRVMRIENLWQWVAINASYYAKHNQLMLGDLGACLPKKILKNRSSEIEYKGTSGS